MNAERRETGRRARLALLLAVLAVTVSCDRITKRVAEDRLASTPPISMLGDTVRLHYTENAGAFLGLGGRLPERARFWLLTVGTGLLLVLVAGRAVLAQGQRPAEVAAWSLVVAGGLSNLWDRLSRDGHVVDFMNLGIGWLRTGIFNVADVAITLGVVVLVLMPRARPAPGPSPEAPPS